MLEFWLWVTFYCTFSSRRSKFWPRRCLTQAHNLTGRFYKACFHPNGDLAVTYGCSLPSHTAPKVWLTRKSEARRFIPQISPFCLNLTDLKRADYRCDLNRGWATLSRRDVIASIISPLISCTGRLLSTFHLYNNMTNSSEGYWTEMTQKPRSQPRTHRTTSSSRCWIWKKTEKRDTALCPFLSTFRPTHVL